MNRAEKELHPPDSAYGRFDGVHKRPMMAMVEITERCNMNCPLCFAGSGANGSHADLAMVKSRVRTLLDVAGPVPIQVSGGEPTLHPELSDIIKFWDFVDGVVTSVKHATPKRYLLVKIGILLMW